MIDDIEYTRGRLLNTIVRYEDEPVIVMSISEKGRKVEVAMCKDTSTIQCVKFTDLNLEAVPLGYIQVGPEAHFSMRKPMRKDWKQGLRLNNMHFPNGNPFLDLPHKELRDTILGRYIKPTEMEKAIDSGYTKVAFHRHWAVTRWGDCLYRDEVVGSFNGGITLSDNRQYLGEYLQEVLNDANG